MKKLAVVVLTALTIQACASVDYQPYEGKSIVHEGMGGAKVTTDGVDFWAHGAPPRKYRVIGVATGEYGEDFNDVAMIQRAVAGEIKKRGGDAAILISENMKNHGDVIVPAGATAVSMPVYSKRLSYYVIQYVD
jgi:hypothetical protein